MRPTRSKSWFSRFAKSTARITGKSLTFMIAVSVVAAWAVTGPLFGFSDTWQLVINTGTTIVTFLMVFLIQSTQNRDAKAVHLKLDELIRALRGARNSLVDLEHLSEKELEDLATEFQSLSKRACAEVDRRTHQTAPRDEADGEPTPTVEKAAAREVSA